MPVTKGSNGKWKVGRGPAVYTSKEAAERAYEAYLAKKHDKKKRGKR